MSVHPSYIFLINDVYDKSVEDNAEIANDSACSLKWHKGYVAYKSNIREHLKREQNGRCAFCRCRVSVGTSWSNLEHLISKSEYPQFKFTSENIVYCCTKCNMSKVKKNIISLPHKDKSQQTFPTDSSGFISLNPYFDDFQAHLDFLDDVIITVANNSQKGRETIQLYKLYRPELAEERASQFQLDQKTINEQLLIRLTDALIDKDIKDQINAVIEQMPSWTL